MLFAKWKNDRLEVLTAAAVVAGKRKHTARQAYCRTCAVQPSEMVTSFYVTFTPEGGEPLELQVPEQVYEVLSEGDRGSLSYQGTKFLAFERS